MKRGVLRKKNVAGKQKNTKAKGDNGRESFGVFFKRKSFSIFLKSQNRENVSFEFKICTLENEVFFKGTTTWWKSFGVFKDAIVISEIVQMRS